MEKQVIAGATRPAVRGRERMVLSADLSALCRDLQECDRVLRELASQRNDKSDGDLSLIAHYREVWGKHRDLKKRLRLQMLAELAVVL